MRFGVNLPGPFWASFNIPQGGRRGRRASGNAGCLTVLLILCFLPLYLIFKAYQFAWGKPQTQRGKILSVSGVSVGLLILIIIGSATGGGSSSPTLRPPNPVGSAASVLSQVSPTASATHKAVAASKSPAPVTTSAVASSSSPAPVQTHTVAPAPTHSSYAPPAPATQAPVTRAPVTRAPVTQAPVPAAPKAGEFCSGDEHGQTVDGLTCSYYPSSGTWHWKH